ncbi:MAG: hypothetical protein COA44_13305 [Arcobacter sp.]|nr:MAG: hypothetical protein COA44_13305 [Arcobacter sp.]
MRMQSYILKESLFQKKQKLYKKPDGSAEVIIKITDKEEIFTVLRFWLPSVRILEPEALQKEFEKKLQDYLNFS